MLETVFTNLFSNALFSWLKELPRPIRWLLGIAAVLIVVILLTLLFGHRARNTDIIAKSDINIVLQYEPKLLVFDNVFVDESSDKSIELTANRDIIIDEIKISETKDFVLNHDCGEQLVKSCTIYVEYEPTSAQKKTETQIIITWHIANQEDIKKEQKIPVTYSAQKKAETRVESKSESKSEPKTFVEPEPVVEIEDEEEEMDEIEEDDEFDDIIVPSPFDEPESKPEQKSKAKPVLVPEKCSEFAIPGYDASGRQIGWIKPERGANYFHPFSDKDCSNPTGRYDFSTGIITSLKDGSKMGTDSDHIGYRNVRNRNLSVPQLSAPISNVARAENGRFGEDAVWADVSHDDTRSFDRTKKTKWEEKEFMTSNSEHVLSSKPHDRTFILRQFKPIPATIVSEVRADPSVYGCSKAKGAACEGENYSIPVRATVDRNVYSDDGRTIILPTGTLLLGYLDGDLPGPYQTFGRMNIKWYQFIRPDGIEFNFGGDDQDPYSADAQGRMGVPGHGSTDYVEQMVMPILTALVPAAVNMIAPITDKVINQIDLDNNTIVQSGTIRSSEMAKQDIINTWNKITQKLLVDAIDNTVPPFSIAAGTRINVFSPVDLVVSCGDKETGVGIQKCAFGYAEKGPRKWSDLKKKVKRTADDSSWVGQIRSFNLNGYCKEKNGKITIDENSNWAESGYDYRTVLAYCEAQNYVAINNAKNAAYSANVQKQADKKKDEYGISQNWTDEGWQTDFTSDEAEQKYNTEVLGLSYDDKGNIINPFAKPAADVEEDSLTCEDGEPFDANGCCPGETFTDMGDAGWNCCPDAGGDCFPPTNVE